MYDWNVRAQFGFEDGIEVFRTINSSETVAVRKSGEDSDFVGVFEGYTGSHFCCCCIGYFLLMDENFWGWNGAAQFVFYLQIAIDGIDLNQRLLSLSPPILNGIHFFYEESAANRPSLHFFVLVCASIT
mmetsp:Transcript_26880/g.34452  ORF Transcript_26880/g.34452 Transcript_26880/m.34452 type:complete len:129 (-) Transcript_26880:22-408(-)